MAIKECTEERYDEMLNILPPAIWVAYGFLVGEPFDHRTCKVTGKIRASYSAFFKVGTKYYESDPMTFPEFLAFTTKDLP